MLLKTSNTIFAIILDKIADPRHQDVHRQRILGRRIRFRGRTMLNRVSRGQTIKTMTPIYIYIYMYIYMYIYVYKNIVIFIHRVSHIVFFLAQDTSAFGHIFGQGFGHGLDDLQDFQDLQNL